MAGIRDPGRQAPAVARLARHPGVLGGTRVRTGCFSSPTRPAVRTSPKRMPTTSANWPPSPERRSTHFEPPAEAQPLRPDSPQRLPRETRPLERCHRRTRTSAHRLLLTRRSPGCRRGEESPRASWNAGAVRRSLSLPDELVGEEDEAVTDGLGIDEAHRLLVAGLAEEARARAEHDWEHDQPQLVDQVMLD